MQWCYRALLFITGIFDEAIKERNKDKTIHDIHELNEIMDNIWRDAHKIRSDTEAVSYGISITLGIAGFFANGLLGIGVELLASLGLSVLDRGLNTYVSEKFAKIINNDYLYEIYDSRRKYTILK